jgi:reverse gyrase
MSSQIVPLKVSKEIVNIEVRDEDDNPLKVEQDVIELVTNVSLPLQINFSRFIYQPVKKIAQSIKSRLDQICEKFPCEFSLQLQGSFVRSKVNLYTQADLVSEMKRKEIGRPSTYATIINTILKRHYAIESKKIKKLIPTNLGIEVNKYLNLRYGKFVSEERTRKLLQLMDMIETGQEKYEDVLAQIYEEIEEIR